MNISFLSLSVSSTFSSPFISDTASYSAKNMLFKRIRANSFFSAFFESGQPGKSVNFHYSSFKKFLNTPIKVTSSLLEDKTYKEQQILKCDKYLTLENCHFSNCITLKSGGALNIECSSSIVVVKNCKFEFCSSTSGNCGAIFMPNLKSCAVFSTCFINCSAIGNYQTFYTNVTSKVALNQTGFHFCGVDAFEGKTQSKNKFNSLMKISCGIQRVSLCNFSMNKVNKGSVGFSAFDPKIGSYQYLNIIRNSGGFAFERYGIAKYEENISHVNIINHNSPKIGTMHLFIFGKMTNFVFKHVTLDPLIFCEVGALIALETSVFDAAEIDIRITSPRGAIPNVFTTKNCTFMESRITPLVFEQKSTLQCAIVEESDKLPILETLLQIVINNPHIFGLIMCIVLGLGFVFIFIRSKKNINLRRVPFAFKQNPPKMI